MSGKKKQVDLKNTLKIRSKKMLKTELAIVQITTDSKKFLNEKKAINHQISLLTKSNNERRQMENNQKIANLICQILQEENWGIYFRNEPIKSLPMKDVDTVLYKVNSVKKDQLNDAIVNKLTKEVFKWENHQEQSQTEEEL